MKYLLTIAFMWSVLFSTAQTKNHNQASQPLSTGRKSSTQVRGSGQYHGSKDTTPGSPMGTGGAGGNEMSGSPKGSALESAVQKDKSSEQVSQSSRGAVESKSHNTVKKKHRVRNRKM